MRKKNTPKGKFEDIAIDKQNIDKKMSFLKEFFNKPKWQYIAIFVGAFILYGNSLTLEYALDDMLMITHNEFTKSGVSGIKDILSNDSFVGFFGEKKVLLSGGRYRPLSQIMFAIEYELFGLNPFIGHLLNILFYALSLIVLLLVLKNIFDKHKGLFVYVPYLVTLLFMAHPLHTEIVANVKGRDDILSFLGSITVMWLVLKYIDKQKIYYLIVIGLVFFLSIMSKENAVTFLAVVPLTIYVFKKPSINVYFYTLTPLIIATAAFVALRLAVLGNVNIGVENELLNNPFVNSDFSEKYASIFYTLGIYVKLLFFPHPLTHDYYPFHVELVSWSSYKAFIPLILYVFLGVYAIKGLFKRDVVAYGIAFYLITFSIASNIVFNIGTFMNERFMYVPLLGFCIVIAYLIVQFLNVWLKDYATKQQYLGLFITAIFILYAGKTISRNFVWKNDFTLFTTDVKVSKNSAKCTVSAAGSLLEASKEIEDTKKKQEYIDLAIEYVKKGVEVHPLYAAAWVIYGNAMLYKELYAEALVCYENVLKIAPRNTDAFQNIAHLGQLANIDKVYDVGLKAFILLDKYQPLNNNLKVDMARSYEGLNMVDSAMALLNAVIKDDSDHYDAHGKLGEIYGKVFFDMEKSIYHLLKSYEAEPKNASNLENLGIAYAIVKDFEKAIYFYEKAMLLNPKKPELYMNMAQTYASMGNNEKASEMILKAQNLMNK